MPFSGCPGVAGRLWVLVVGGGGGCLPVLAVGEVVGEAGPAAACAAGDAGPVLGGLCSPGADLADVGGGEQQRGEQGTGSDAAGAAACWLGEGFVGGVFDVSALPRLALLALIWGSAFLWIKLAIRGFSPVEVTLARLALGAVVLFPIVLARREVLPRSAPMWAHITVATLFANAFLYLLFAVAEQTVASSTAGIINATTPSGAPRRLWMLRLSPA